MPHVSLRVTDEEKKMMDAYAKVHSINLSDAIKEAFFQMLEYEYDLKLIEEHRERKARGEVKLYTLDEIEEELGLTD
ncbi:MAG: DUF6290 family protein [Defluviitaleaceae bacterium]|nr:DUF6290 family protein [Defluviitaleaceae bacterium]